MIRSFRDSRTRDFYNGYVVKQLEPLAKAASRRLDLLNEASSLADLAAIRGNRLEILKGDRKGQYSIRINDQWRICFHWPSGEDGPSDVEIVDYH